MLSLFREFKGPMRPVKITCWPLAAAASSKYQAAVVSKVCMPGHENELPCNASAISPEETAAMMLQQVDTTQHHGTSFCCSGLWNCNSLLSAPMMFMLQYE